MTAATSLFRAARRTRAIAARNDFATFCELVLRDEESNEPIKLAEHHRLFIRILEENDQAVILSFVESGKTQIVSVAYTLFCLGRDPSWRVAILSSTAAQAEKVSRAIGRHIEHSAELRQVFPHMKPATPWNAFERTITRPTLAKDSSVTAFGLDGPVSGFRADLLVADDLCDVNNSSSEAQRARLEATFDSEFWMRQTGRARFVSIGTPYHRDDLNFALIDRGIAGYRFGVIRNYDSQPWWPSRWPLRRIAKVRRGLPAREAARQLDCTLVSDEASVFRDEWINRAVELGARYTPLSRDPSGRPALLARVSKKIVVGCDPAASTKATADLSAIAVVMEHVGGMRELLSVESGRWNTPDLVARILNVHNRFLPDALVIESTGFQQSLASWVRHFDDMANVIGYSTARGEKSLDARLGDLEVELAQALWAFPSQGGRIIDPEVAVLAQQLTDYRHGDHVPDRIAALLLALWGLREAKRNRVEVGVLDTMTR